MFLKHILPGVSWAIFILLLCGMPPQNLGDFSLWDMFNPDKIFHFGVFSLLALFLIIGFKKQYYFPKLRCNAFVAAIAISIAYGIVIEFVQILFFSGREGEWLDIIANTLGASFGYILFKIIYGNTIISTS